MRLPCALMDGPADQTRTGNAWRQTRSTGRWAVRAESVALTMFGGLIGLSLGWGVSTAVASLTSFQTQVSWASAALAVSVSTGIGVIFGWYPARQAARLNAIDALRYQ